MITCIQYVYVILPYVNHTLTSLYDENSKLLTTKVHRSQHWMCHWFSQTQTIKTTSRGLVQVLISWINGWRCSEASLVDLGTGICHHSGHSTGPMFNPAPYTVHHLGSHPPLTITSVSLNLITLQGLGSSLDALNPPQQFLFSRKQVFFHSLPCQPRRSQAERAHFVIYSRHSYSPGCCPFCRTAHQTSWGWRCGTKVMARLSHCHLWTSGTWCLPSGKLLPGFGSVV